MTNERDINYQQTQFALTNITLLTTLDVNACTAQQAGDLVGTLIKMLIEKGVIGGTATTH